MGLFARRSCERGAGKLMEQALRDRETRGGCGHAAPPAILGRRKGDVRQEGQCQWERAWARHGAAARRTGRSQIAVESGAWSQSARKCSAAQCSAEVAGSEGVRGSGVGGRGSSGGAEQPRRRQFRRRRSISGMRSTQQKLLRLASGRQPTAPSRKRKRHARTAAIRRRPTSAKS